MLGNHSLSTPWFQCEHGICVVTTWLWWLTPCRLRIRCIDVCIMPSSHQNHRHAAGRLSKCPGQISFVPATVLQRVTACECWNWIWNEYNILPSRASKKLELSCKGLGAAKNLRSSSNYFHLSSGINKIHEPAFWHLEGAFQPYEWGDCFLPESSEAAA